MVLADYLLLALVLVGFITQVMSPIIMRRPLFPIFRKKPVRGIRS